MKSHIFIFPKVPAIYTKMQVNSILVWKITELLTRVGYLR